MLITANELRARLQRLDAEISQHEVSLRLLREAIAQHEFALPSLQEERRGVLEELRQSLIYPVLTLPFEITSQIFLDCLPEDSDDAVRPYPSQDEAPLVFTRVCRDWREIAISTSTLWNRVHIDLDSDDGRGHLDAKWVALLDIWLHRSQPQPLSVTICNRSYTDPHETLVDVLDRHSQRWRDVTLKLPFNHFSRLDAPTSLPVLERLTLSAHGSPDMINPISAFRHAPMLRHLCLEAGMHPSDVILPWEQLTTLEFYGASADDCLELLRLTPNVASCVLDIQFASHGLALGSPLLSLRSFTFSGPAGWGMLRYLVMPVLEKLDLTRSPIGPRNVAQLLHFIGRSECQLRDLKLYVRSAMTAQTILLLRCLPSLSAVELTLAEADIGTAILRELKPGGDGVILPNLRRMALRCIHDDNQHWQVVFDVVTEALELRSQGSGRLESFALWMDNTDPTPSAEIRQRWRELAANGMELCIESPHGRWI
ncbi:hypothetical protein C8R44DRAFT_784202 [Mycena epipterygia]|nr:hypothetical protein C8R44DRAFT_784202 [Mycena epipterygia]